MTNEETFEDFLAEMRGNFYRNGKHAKDVEEIMHRFADKAEYFYNRDINRRILINDSCVAQIALQLDSHIDAVKQSSKIKSHTDSMSESKNYYFTVDENDDSEAEIVG